MDVKLRPGTAEDAEACGRICYDAFAAIAAAHGVPCDFPSVEVATAVISSLLAPIRMVFHSRFVLLNLLGRTVTWRSLPAAGR